MKKLYIVCALAAVAFGFNSCSEDRGPKYHEPTTFVLNTPAMQDQHISLENSDLLELVCSQPDYGFAAAFATYGADVSLTSDFAEYESIEPVNTRDAAMNFKSSTVAIALCNLLGLDGQDSYNEKYPDGVIPYMPVYFRATCMLDNVEGSSITSNVVNYKYIQPYFAVATPDYIYLIGNPSGWDEPKAENASSLAEWRLWEPESGIGSKIYSGVFELPAAPEFRFYTELTGWDGGATIGYQEADEGTPFPEFTGEDTFTSKLVNGKGNFSFPNFPGGEVTIVVNLADENNMTLTISAGEVEVFVPSYIYAIGSFTDPGWIMPSEDNAAEYEPYKMYNSSSAQAVFTGSFDVEAGDVYIRFAYELLGWDDGQWGYQVDDESTLFDLNDNSFTSDYVKGKGSWQFSLPSDGKLNAAVDTENETVTFTFVPAE